jgi:hypothetical protein
LRFFFTVDDYFWEQRMKSLLFKLAAVSLVVVLSLSASAQDAGKKGKGRKAPTPVDGVEKKLAELDITAEQKEKVKPILAEYRGKFLELQKKFASQLTPEQKQAQREARQKATAEGKKGKELRQEVDAALNLTEEQKKAQQEQAKEAGELRANLKKALAGVLNEEQVNQLGLGGGRGKKKNR